MSCADLDFDIDLGSLLINNTTMKSNNFSYNAVLNSRGIFEFSCDDYVDHSKWMSLGIC